MFSRRGIAVAAASATLGAGLVSPVVSAHAATSQAPATGAAAQSILGLDILDTLLALLGPGADVQALLAQFGVDTPAELADVLTGADTDQLTTLLAGLTPAQLQGALGALAPSDLLDVLSELSGGDLAGVFALLSPAQVTGLLEEGGLDEVVAGLRALAAGLTAGTPAAAQVDALLAQVQALLTGAEPDELGDLDGLLSQLAPLLMTAGLDPAQLASLTALLQAITNPSAGVQTLLAILAPAGVPIDPSTGQPLPQAGGPGPGTNPGGGPGTGTTPPASMSVRASVSKPRLNRKRKVARVKVKCPVAAPVCMVAVNGRVGARKAFKQRALSMTPGARRTLRIKLAKRATKKLRKGRKLTVTALTGGSTLGPAKSSVKPRKLKQR